MKNLRRKIAINVSFNPPTFDIFAVESSTERVVEQVEGFFKLGMGGKLCFRGRY